MPAERGKRRGIALAFGSIKVSNCTFEKFRVVRASVLEHFSDMSSFRKALKSRQRNHQERSQVSFLGEVWATCEPTKQAGRTVHKMGKHTTNNNVTI